jgi:hypothetical protein
LNCQDQLDPCKQQTVSFIHQHHHHSIMSSSSSTMIQPGRVVQIHSLQSAAGQELNGQRAVVLRHVPEDDRFEIVLEDDDDPNNASKAIRRANLKVCERLSLPASNCNNRGVVMAPCATMNRKLCEMLLWHKEDYQPPETMLTGIAGMSFQRMDQWNFEHFVSVQMEQMAGALALGNICKQAGALSTSDVIFALLEGDVMYLEALAQTLYWTGYIGPTDENEHDNDFHNCPPTLLTPDQTKAAYIRTMAEGPLLLLREASRYNKIGQALFAAFRTDCQFYHLLVQRLLRLMARETLGTTDGTKLGKMARSILQDGILGGEASASIPTSMSATAAHHIMNHAAEVLSSPDKATNGAILELLCYNGPTNES